MDKRRIPRRRKRPRAGIHEMKETIRKIFEESIEAKRSFFEEQTEDLIRVIHLIADAFTNQRKLLLFGNGGSAADAQHIAAEFVNRFQIERPPLPAIALTTDTSAITSIANDYDYVEIFAKQVKALGLPGDIAFAISTSGNAANVIRGIEMCRSLGITTIGLTGGDGGRMRSLVDHALVVSGSTNTARIQESHILIAHTVCEMVDRQLFS